MNRQIGGIRAAGAIALGAALLMGAVACSGGKNADAAPEGALEMVLAPTDVALVESTVLGSGVALTGSLDPYRVVEVRAQVPGTVRGLRVDRGQAVSLGQVMASLEADGIRSQAAGAQAGVAAAEAGVALARRQLESARTLYEAGALSEIDFRGAATQQEAAQAQLAAAHAQAAGAGEQARRATITAPIAGEVSRRTVSEGEAVNPGQALFTVVNTEYLELAGQVPVEQAAAVRVGQAVEFEISAYPGRTFRGEVARVEPTADPVTRQVGVYVRLPNRDRALVGGLFATGKVLSGSTQEVLVVPSGAIRRDGAEAFVFVVENGAAVRHPVTVGAQDAARGVNAISGELKAGDQVIVAPGEIEAGARVRVGSDAAAAPAKGVS